VKVNREKTEDCQAFLTIELEPEELEESLENSYRRMVKKTSIPGFRKGKVPRSVFEQYVGRDRILDEALEEAIPQAYRKALDEQEIEPIAQPQLEITQNDPVIFKAVVPLKPTVQLGDYKSIRIDEEPVDFKEESVDSTIEQLRHQHAVWEPMDRPVEYNDMVVLDIESNLGEKPFINREGLQYQVIKDIAFPVPGFAEELLEMKAGDTKEFNLSLPEQKNDEKKEEDAEEADVAEKEDSAEAEVESKEVLFKVTIKEIKQEKLPELDDEFAAHVSEEFKSMDALKEKVSENLRLDAEDKARGAYEQKVVEAVAGMTETEYPPIIVELEIDELIRDRMRRWQMTDDRLEEYLKMINKSLEELREELRQMAAKRVMNSLVLDKITETESIDVSEDEVNEEVEKLLKDVEQNQEEVKNYFNNPQSRLSIKQVLTRRKTLEKLLAIAKGEDIPIEDNHAEEIKAETKKEEAE